ARRRARRAQAHPPRPPPPAATRGARPRAPRARWHPAHPRGARGGGLPLPLRRPRRPPHLDRPSAPERGHLPRRRAGERARGPARPERRRGEPQADPRRAAEARGRLGHASRRRRLAEEERVREVLGRAARTLFPPAVLARRLAGTAYLLAETGRALAARRALAVALVLGARGADAMEIPLVAALVERAVGGLLAQ